MKKILSMCMIFALMICMTACTKTEKVEEKTHAEVMPVEATDTIVNEEPVRYKCGDYSYILLPDGSAEIVHINTYKGRKQLILPETIDGHTVTSIGEDPFEWGTSIETVTISDTIVNIDRNPFRYCGALKEIIVSINHPTLATIDHVLFDKTEKRLVAYPQNINADTYEIPYGIQVIGEKAFEDCRLHTVVIPDSVVRIEENAFANSRITNITIPDSVNSIGAGAFSECDSLTSFTIPGSVTSIEAGTFSMCDSLSSITIPDSVTAIGEDAFYCCDALKTVTLPSSLTCIGEGAFRLCKGMTSINIPGSVTHIGEGAFNSCIRLETIDIAEDHPVFELVDGVLFDKNEKLLLFYPNKADAPHYDIPDGTRVIGNGAFYDCKQLASIHIPDTVTRIGKEAFNESGITSIHIPGSITAIGEKAFGFCRNLTDVVFSDGLITIERMTFIDCSSLTNIVLPDTLTDIKEDAFHKCTALTEITFPAQLTNIGFAAFAFCDALESITIPGSVANISDSAFSNCRSLSDVIISNGVTKIGDSAFSRCTSLQRITIPASVTGIGEGAFNDVPASVVFTVERDSYAAQYAEENNIQYIYPDSFDWLNN